MQIDEDAVATLAQLGLTSLESKIYFALCRYGESSSKEISKLTKTAQSDIYRVVNSLQKRVWLNKELKNRSGTGRFLLRRVAVFFWNENKSNMIH